MAKTFLELSQQVMPYARQCLDLPEPWCDDPEHQAMRALWHVILHPGRNINARLTAIREYYDRVHGKSGQEGDGDEGREEYDISKLTADEQTTFLALLGKMKGDEDVQG